MMTSSRRLVLPALLSVAIASNCPNAMQTEESDMLACEDDGYSLLQVGRVSSSEVAIPVSHENARGFAGEIQEDLKPSEYTLSEPASKFGYTPSNALLDGGGEEWKLFPNGKVPEELPGDTGKQILQVNDPGDRCAAGDIAGYSIIRVSEPTVVPFILEKDHDGRKPLAIIIAPGGGDRYLSWNKEGTDIAKWLNSLGISAFVLKYRVPVNSPETKHKSLVDAQRAISLVRSKSAEYEYDFKSVGFMGFSAGGFLAAWVSIDKKAYQDLDAVDTENFKPDFVMCVYAAGSQELDAYANTAPPTFIALARDDQCVSPARAQTYYEHLMAPPGGAEHELHIYASGHHGYGDCDLYVMGNAWLPVCAWTINAQLFIERQLGVAHEMKVMKYADKFAST